MSMMRRVLSAGIRTGGHPACAARTRLTISAQYNRDLITSRGFASTTTPLSSAKQYQNATTAISPASDTQSRNEQQPKSGDAVGDTAAAAAAAAQPGTVTMSDKEQISSSSSSSANMSSTPQQPQQRKKTILELDEELRQKMTGLLGRDGGGEAGVEYEDGKPVAMKRGVRENMFRLI